VNEVAVKILERPMYEVYEGRSVGRRMCFGCVA